MKLLILENCFILLWLMLIDFKVLYNKLLDDHDNDK